MPKYIINFENGTFDQKYKVNKSIFAAHDAMVTEAFLDKVMSHTKRDSSPGFFDCEMTSKEIYDVLMSSSWVYNIRFYSKRFSSANAYVQPPSKVVNLNWAKMKFWPTNSLANTTTHEATHLFGFEHSYFPTDDRPYSVPYAIGEIIEELIGPSKIDVDTIINKKFKRPWYRRLF